MQSADEGQGGGGAPAVSRASAQAEPGGAPAVAVTGAGGFVGRAVTEALLLAGWRVHALSRSAQGSGGRVHPALRWFEGDLTTGRIAPGFLRGADRLLHLAGELVDESAMEALHVQGTRTLLAQAQEAGVRRVVHLSSVGVYGPLRSGRVNEETPFAPRGPYEETKAEAERIVQRWGASGAGQGLILRPTIVYGPGMRSSLLTALARAVRRGWMVRLGGPEAMLPMVAVEDVAQALLRAAAWPHDGTPWRAWNVADDLPVDTWLALLADAQGVRPPRARVPAQLANSAARIGGRLPGFPLTPQRVLALTRDVRYLADRARRELGWQPLCPHSERVVQFLRSVQP